MPDKLTMPVHFEDFSGEQFERLTFAYHLRVDDWLSLEWYGQVGSDLGRDIFGRKEDDREPGGLRVCIQCVNRKTLTEAKVKRDLQKAAAAPTGTPHLFRFVCRANVSAALRRAGRNRHPPRRSGRCSSAARNCEPGFAC